MPRVKRGTRGVARRKKVLAHTKGFKWRRKNVYKIAVDAMRHALVRSYQGRKEKKRRNRVLWNAKINALARQNDTTYSKLIHGLKQNNIELDRKVLSDIAEQDPTAFKKIVEKVGTQKAQPAKDTNAKVSAQKTSPQKPAKSEK